jgi:kynurenine formamidase
MGKSDIYTSSCMCADERLSATQNDVHAAGRTAVNGLQPWTERGVVGRGVLIDFASYAEKKGLNVSHFTPHGITLAEVLEIAKEQGVEFHTGDILLLRTGYAAAYKKLDDEKRKDVASVKEWCGLAQSRETTEWLWERQFAAVASDSPGFEVRREYSSW